MPRIRSVHPDICISARMASLPAALERTFTRLWTHCDDGGRCLDNPRLIKAAIYPLHDEQTWEVVNDELSMLEEAGLVVRYEADGIAAIQVRSWDEYQHPQRPSPSKLPPPPLVDISRTPRVQLHAGVGEGEGVGEGVVVLASKPTRDQVWATLAELFGEPTTASNKTLRGKIVKSLSAAGATSDEIRLRVQAWPHHFPDATLTEPALEKHWDRLGKSPARMSKSDIQKYQAELRRFHRTQDILDGGTA